jgi:hypothetical protein
MGHVRAIIRLGTLCVVLAALAATGACRTRLGGGKASQAAMLAKRVTELEREVQSQMLRANEAEAKLHALPQQGDEIARATPVIAGIEVDRLSGAAPGDVTSFPVFIRTLDGRGRFQQAVGRLEVEVFAAPQGDGSMVRVGGVVLGPLDLREAYRSGVAGTHYRVDVPIENSFRWSPGYRGAPARYDMRIEATLEDALTGQRYQASGVIRARDRAAGPAKGR